MQAQQISRLVRSNARKFVNKDSSTWNILVLIFRFLQNDISEMECSEAVEWL